MAVKTERESSCCRDVTPIKNNILQCSVIFLNDMGSTSWVYKTADKVVLWLWIELLLFSTNVGACIFCLQSHPFELRNHLGHTSTMASLIIVFSITVPCCLFQKINKPQHIRRIGLFISFFCFHPPLAVITSRGSDCLEWATDVLVLFQHSS